MPSRTQKEGYFKIPVFIRTESWLQNPSVGCCFVIYFLFLFFQNEITFVNERVLALCASLLTLYENCIFRRTEAYFSC